jgi:hypothetical protein
VIDAICFTCSAVIAAALSYVFAHDVASLCNTTIFNASTVTGSALGAAWLGALLALDLVAHKLPSFKEGKPPRGRTGGGPGWPAYVLLCLVYFL